MKKKIAEFRKGYGTASSTASPMPKPKEAASIAALPKPKEAAPVAPPPAKEAAYRALPGTAPRPGNDPPSKAPGRPPSKAMPAEIAGSVRPTRAPGGGDDGGDGDDDEYSLETIDEEESEEEEERGDDPLVLIEGAAVSWQLKVFVALENETMEDLLYRAVRTKLYDRRPNVTPFVRGDPWTNGCVAVGWMTDGLKFVCFSERLGFRMKYVNSQWTGYTLFFQRRPESVGAYNGHAGVVQAYHEAAGAYTVQLDSNGPQDITVLQVSRHNVTPEAEGSPLPPLSLALPVQDTLQECHVTFQQ
eukprot:s5520_g3.t1